MNKKWNKILKILLFCTIAFVMINAVRSAFSPYVKQVAKRGTYVDVIEATALVVRNETVLHKGTTGIMEPSVAEGERVAANQRVGAVVTGNISEDKVAELNAINEKIENLSDSISEAGLLTIDDSKVEVTLAQSLNNLQYAAVKSDTGDAIDLCESIRILTERKAGITTSSTAQKEMEELIVQRDNLAKSLGGSHVDVFATKSGFITETATGIGGLYSGNMDGMESVLTFDAIKEVTPDEIDTYFKQAEKSKAEGPCKIVNNYKWYIVFNLTGEECEGLTVGSKYPVVFKDVGERQINGTVKYISEPDKKGRRAVTMYFDRQIENLTELRETTVEICKKTYSGIYIPRDALRVNNVQGVWVQNEAVLEFRSVVEVYRSDEFLLVKENAEGQGGHENIVLYDNIVMNPDK